MNLIDQVQFHDFLSRWIPNPSQTFPHLNTAFRILVGEHRPQGLGCARVSNQPRPDIQLGCQSPIPIPSPPTAYRATQSALPRSLQSRALPRSRPALEDAARTSATVFGKPTRAFFEAVLIDLDRNRDVRTVMVTPAPPGGDRRDRR
ncbi:hypothetical protein OG21DRAFT_908428 [Imleria badia]|nr:hypothetical protein OG21DRAFT_908428 [Imleria badia]